MDKTMQTALMKDFTAEQMGHKPATWCRQCSEVVRSRKGKSCTDHREIRCDKCKTKITEAHVCLDFVGHADVRARLCEVDPEWTWAPFEFPGTGSLVLNDGQPVGLWIHLTIGGVSKPGYGSCEKGKSEAVKELIGDAIRNAGLSFGIAWKLWAKGERSSNDSASANGQQQGESFEGATPAPARQRAEGNGQPASGQAVRPAQAPRPAAAQPGGEPDPDAQPYADEAHEARVTETLKDIHTRARDAHKLAALIRNPATGGTGGLGQYLNHRRSVLQKTEQALAALRAAAAPAGIDDTGLELLLKESCGHGLEEASAEEMAKATEVILAETGAVA